MTVINAMRFNKKEGAMVADEKSSSEQRMYDVATKIGVYAPGDIIALVGGSGSAGFLYESKKDFENAIYEPGATKIGEAAANLLAQVTSRRKLAHIDASIRSAYGIGLPELFNPDVAAKYPSAARDLERIQAGQSELSKVFNSGFILLAADGTDVGLYYVNPFSEKAQASPSSYGTIGSGSDAADNSLTPFTQRLTRDERKSIEPVDGLAALISGLNQAALRNPGVGGTPQIVAVRDGKIYSPKDSESKLASEIVLASDENLVPVHFRDDAINRIVYKGEGFTKLNRDFKRAAANKHQLDLLLRGYKH